MNTGGGDVWGVIVCGCRVGRGTAVGGGGVIGGGRGNNVVHEET